MHRTIRLILGLAALTAGSAGAQPSSYPETPGAAAVSRMTKFDLDFPGGTPKELVAAIQKATNHPLNAIIPAEFATWKLPPIRMTGVNVAQLFRALDEASRSSYVAHDQYGNTQRVSTGYGFAMASEYPNGRGSVRTEVVGPTDDTVWIFNASLPEKAPKISRFYLLTPYLNGGLTVDDITTAIQTGWKMQGNVAPPTLSFHKETKLLIAVGDTEGLSTIDAALRALEPIRAKPAPAESADEHKTKP